MIVGRIKEGYGIVQRDVMCMENLSIHAKAVYALFVSYTGQKDCCFPAIKTVCKNLGISYPTVTKAIKELEEIQLLSVDRTLGESSIYYPNYVLKSETNEEIPQGKKIEKKETLKFTTYNGQATYVGFENYTDENKITHTGFWCAYSKKVDKRKTTKAWEKLNPKIRAMIMTKIPLYIAHQPNRQYRKSPYSYLLNECWGDEDLHQSTPTNNSSETAGKKRLSSKW